jgi:hypothetical protein
MLLLSLIAGALDGIEKAKREMAKPDSIVSRLEETNRYLRWQIDIDKFLLSKKIDPYKARG